MARLLVTSQHLLDVDLRLWVARLLIVSIAQFVTNLAVYSRRRARTHVVFIFSGKLSISISLGFYSLLAQNCKRGCLQLISCAVSSVLSGTCPYISHRATTAFHINLLIVLHTPSLFGVDVYISSLSTSVMAWL